ncbi:Topless-related protein 2 [Capsicum annuum]|nr:Topless-related protein 2 [Capsicum annuum]
MTPLEEDSLGLFSCGTSKEGESHLVEWNESEGAIKRTFSGFRKRSLGVVQFDTTRNRFLAAGDEFQIKFWEMDNTNMLTYTDGDGGLPASPRLRFNKEGSLLAVTTSDNGIKVLANTDGQRMLRMLESRAFEGSRAFSDVNVKPPIAGSLGPIPNISGSAPQIIERSDRTQQSMSIGNLATMESSRVPDVKPKIAENMNKIKSWKFSDITDSSQLKTLKLPDPQSASKVLRLLYTNSGLAVLALGSNAIHKLWKWQRNERNPSGKSSAAVSPQLWLPANGALMSNDVGDAKSAEDAAACIALSKNDSYVMSASGGKVSLFNMMTFKVMTTFMPPPPAATYLAFHPQDNNVIAVGMEDSTIQIYNVRVDELPSSPLSPIFYNAYFSHARWEYQHACLSSNMPANKSEFTLGFIVLVKVKIKLKGHQKRITGLAFSQSLNVLLCIWSVDGWDKKKARPIQAPPGHQAPLVGETRVQFHNDQSHVLVVHESQIGIYDTQLECQRSWYPRDSLSAPISSAIYSCDGLLIFTGFCDGAIGIFDADSLRLRCRIAPPAYLSSISSTAHVSSTVMLCLDRFIVPKWVALHMGNLSVLWPTNLNFTCLSSGSGATFPVVIAAHPSDSNQFALGMSDGAVHVMEPSDAEPRWGGSSSQDNGAMPSIPSSSALNSQLSETPSR